MTLPSYICSKYYPWFVELGYDRLDIAEYADGSWDIIEYETVPIVPCTTRFKTILGNMKRVEKSFGFVKKYVESIDLQKKAIWDREEKKTQEMLDEKDRVDRAAQDRVDAAFNVMRKNPDLVDRIARNGLQEMNLDKIARHVPKAELNAQRKSYNSKL